MADSAPTTEPGSGGAEPQGRLSKPGRVRRVHDSFARWVWGRDVWRDSPDEPELALTPESEAEKAAIFEAATAHVVNRPDGIRQRAQNAATVSAVAAATLGAFGGLAGITTHQWWVQLAVVVALVAWLVAMAADVRAIAYSHGEMRIEKPAEVFGRFSDYSVRMRKVVRQAMVATMYAIGLTAVSVAALIFSPVVDDPDGATVTLTDGAAERLRTLCQWPSARTTMEASLRTSDLSRPFVELTLDAGACGGNKTTIRLRSRGIVAVRSESE